MRRVCRAYPPQYPSSLQREYTAKVHCEMSEWIPIELAGTYYSILQDSITALMVGVWEQCSDPHDVTFVWMSMQNYHLVGMGEDPGL